MKFTFKTILMASLSTLVFPMISCDKTNAEKTTTIIRTKDAPKQEEGSGLEIQINTDNKGISIETSKH